MNLKQASVVLRPRTVSEVLDLACLWLTSKPLSLTMRLSAVVLAPVFVIVMTCRYLFEWSPPALWALAFALVTPLQGVFTIAAGRMFFSEELTVKQALRLFARRWASFSGAMLLSRLLPTAAIIVGLLMFYAESGAAAIITVGMFALIPLVIVGVRQMFVHEASLLEMASAREATRRSPRLVQHRSSGTFQGWMGLLLAQAGIMVVAEVLGHGVVNTLLQLGEPFGSMTNDFFSPYALIGLLASAPYVAFARYLFYIDTRTRTDGWDIQVRFFAVAADQEQRRLEA